MLFREESCPSCGTFKKNISLLFYPVKIKITHKEQINSGFFYNFVRITKLAFSHFKFEKKFFLREPG
jgi:hypothetical protein